MYQLQWTPFYFWNIWQRGYPTFFFVQSMYILNIQCSYKTIVKKISFSWIWLRFCILQKISSSVIIPLLPCEISWFQCECLSVPQKSLLLSWVYYNNFLLNSWRHVFFTYFLGPQEGFEDTKGVNRRTDNTKKPRWNDARYSSSFPAAASPFWLVLKVCHVIVFFHYVV